MGVGAPPQSSHHVHPHTCKSNQLLTCMLPPIKERKRGKTGIASSCMGGRRCGRGARGLRRASGPFVRLMTAAKAAITFITQKTGSSTALSTPCALPMTLSKSGQLASEAFTYFKFSFPKHKITTFGIMFQPQSQMLAFTTNSLKAQGVMRSFFQLDG